MVPTRSASAAEIGRRRNSSANVCQRKVRGREVRALGQGLGQLFGQVAQKPETAMVTLEEHGDQAKLQFPYKQAARCLMVWSAASK